jgi:translation initiation factor 3 subunit C
VQSSSESEEE